MQMGNNEVRPIFRVLTLLLASGAWYVSFLIIHTEISTFNSTVIPFNWVVFIITIAFVILMLFTAIAFTFTTVLGYMPQKLFKVFSGQSSKS